MALIDIPEQWRADVTAILETGQSGTLIQWTLDARRRYEADSNFAWEFEVYEAFQEFLCAKPCQGCVVQMGTPRRCDFTVKFSCAAIGNGSSFSLLIDL